MLFDLFYCTPQYTASDRIAASLVLHDTAGLVLVCILLVCILLEAHTAAYNFWSSAGQESSDMHTQSVG